MRQRWAERQAGVRIPKPRGLVPTAGGGDLVVRTKGDRGHKLLVRQRLADPPARVCIPELGGLIVAGGQHLVAIGAKGDRSDAVVVLQAAELLPRGNVPQAAAA